MIRPTLAAVAALALAAFSLPALLNAEQQTTESRFARTAPPQPQVGPEGARAVVDFTRDTGDINRGLFSTQGFMQIYVQPNPMVLHTWKLTNPKGTQTRLETWISRMEPDNDDDDPENFNWDNFYPERMIRKIEDKDTFLEKVEDLGMEPLSLLAYNVDWNMSHDPDDPIKDKEEWAEFAAAVIETYNGSGDDYRPNMRFAQIWNEPNMDDFYGGTPESYFELFRVVAERVRRDYPGVMLMGPNISHAWHSEPQLWMDRFLDEVGHLADVIVFHHYGPMGEGTDVIMDYIRERAEAFRSIPGKEQGQVMITETDAWFVGWEKMQFILERQFGFLDLADLILGVHHFSALAYNESGNYTFGVVDSRGGVLDGVFWPYWLFRNLYGEKAFHQREGLRGGDLQLAASWAHEDGRRLESAVMQNRSEEPLDVEALLFFEPADHERILAVERVREDFHGVARVERIAPGTGRLDVTETLVAGEAMALNLLDPGERFFHFRDMNSQEQPAIRTRANVQEVTLFDEIVIEAEIVNTTFEPVSGRLRVGSLPEDWTTAGDAEEWTVRDLQFGESHSATFTISVNSIVPEGFIAPFVYLDTGGIDDPVAARDAIAHAVPLAFKVNNPLNIIVLPQPVQAVRGETNLIEVQMTNTTEEPLGGTGAVSGGEGIATDRALRPFEVEGGERIRIGFPLRIGSDAPLGAQTATVTLEVLGTTVRKDFQIVVNEMEPVENAITLDLEEYLNFDAVAFDANRRDYDYEEMGMFVYPGDYTPSDRVVNVYGKPYRIASLEDGKKNVILPRGQRIRVDPTRTERIAMMGFGHDGRHPGTWVLHYADGSSQEVDSMIPEWCTPPPEGYKVAFTAPHRYTPHAHALPPCELFVWSIAADPERELTEIELPELRHGYLFAVTLIGAE